MLDAFGGASVAAPVLHIASLWVFLVAASFVVVVAAIVSSVPPLVAAAFLVGVLVAIRLANGERARL